MFLFFVPFVELPARLVRGVHRALRRAVGRRGPDPVEMWVYRVVGFALVMTGVVVLLAVTGE